MTEDQERRVRAALTDLVAIMNEAGEDFRLEHEALPILRIGDPFSRYRHSITVDIVQTKRIQVG